jgi:hypothetical protein
MAYNYTMLQRTGYTMFQISPTPAGYTDIHLTISSDDAQMMPDGSIMVEQMWKRPHVTFMWNAGAVAKKYHAFIVTRKNKYAPSDQINDIGMRGIFTTMMTDKAISDALFSPEDYITK